jgi:hypothetical protein
LAYYKVSLRKLLVSKRAYQVLQRLRVRGVVFTPVEFKVGLDVNTEDARPAGRTPPDRP